MAKNSPDEGKNIKMVEKQAVEASMINLKEYRIAARKPLPPCQSRMVPAQRQDGTCQYGFQPRCQLSGNVPS